MTTPTRDEIRLLHTRYAASQQVLEEIWQHCCIVSQIALSIIETKHLKDIDKSLVETGALLHDIGVYKLFDTGGKFDEINYIRHGVLGYDLLKQAGLSERLCRFASHHTGVGLTADEISRRNLPLPHQDMLADSEAERVVMYADKFHSKLPSRFNSFAWYKQHVARFGEDKVEQFEQMAADFGKVDVKQLAHQYKQEYR